MTTATTYAEYWTCLFGDLTEAACAAEAKAANQPVRLWVNSADEAAHAAGFRTRTSADGVAWMARAIREIEAAE